jgi:chemotaxis response regulator CheB
MPTRILAVDDSRAIRHSLRSYIEAQSYWQICGEAENGKVAVEMTQTLSPNLVILDLSMPVTGGSGDAGTVFHLRGHTGVIRI